MCATTYAMSPELALLADRFESRSSRIALQSALPGLYPEESPAWLLVTRAPPRLPRRRPVRTGILGRLFGRDAVGERLLASAGRL